MHLPRMLMPCEYAASLAMLLCCGPIRFPWDVFCQAEEGQHAASEGESADLDWQA